MDNNFYQKLLVNIGVGTVTGLIIASSLSFVIKDNFLSKELGFIFGTVGAIAGVAKSTAESS